MALVYWATGFFSLAIILGMILLAFVMGGKETPKAVVFTHGPLAAIGLVLLIVYLFDAAPSPIESVILFVMAATGGLYMFYKDLTGKKVPRALAIGHAILAIAGFVFLLVYAICRWSWLA
jgi:hypothetical protein